jgi:hypothetical protein
MLKGFAARSTGPLSFVLPSLPLRGARLAGILLATLVERR